MRRCSVLLAFLGLFCCFSAARPDEPGYLGILRGERTLTRPLLPTDTALGRLGMKKVWHLQVPVESIRDGLATVQIIGPQIVVRTFAGLLLCLDAETGATQWQTYMGRPYSAYVLGVGANEDVFLVMADLKMYGLNRRNGNIEWSYEIPGTPITQPAADRRLMFIATNEGRVRLLNIPQPLQPGTIPGKAQPGQDQSKGLVDAGDTKVMEVWSMMLAPPLPQPPIFTDEFILFVDGMNHIGSYDRDKREVIDRFIMRDRPAAPMVALGDTIFLANRDRTLYVVDIYKGLLELRWKFIAEGPFVQRPHPIETDVFVGAAGPGLYCLDRDSGQLRWTQPQALRFLSASKRLVFALSHDQKLLVLDRARGLILAALDARNYAYGVQNLYSDRFLLANHDGTLVCLRDASKEMDKPAVYQVPPPKKVPAVTKPKPTSPGEDAKEEEETPKKKDNKKAAPKGQKKGEEEEMKDNKKKGEEEEDMKGKKKGEEEEEMKDKKDAKGKPDPKKPDPKDKK